MKLTLSTDEAALMLHEDENGDWSYAGARAMVEYLEELEESCGEEIEFDVVSIRCDYSEYRSLQEWAEGYFSDWKADLDIDDEIDDEGYIDDKIREYINDNGALIEFNDGIIVSSF